MPVLCNSRLASPTQISAVGCKHKWLQSSRHVEDQRRGRDELAESLAGTLA